MDTKSSFCKKAICKSIGKYWSVIDQTGLIKAMPLKLNENYSIIFEHKLESGNLIIFNKTVEFEEWDGKMQKFYK